MATKNPRISVMLKPSSDAILKRLSELSGQSKSSIVAEFLEDACMPMLERTVMILEAANNATDEAKLATKKGFEEAEKRLMDVMGITSDLFEEASKPLLDEAEKVQRRAVKTTSGRDAQRAPARLSAASRPPLVTRGSGTPKPGISNAKTTSDDGLGDESLKEAPKPLKRAAKPSSKARKG